MSTRCTRCSRFLRLLLLLGASLLCAQETVPSRTVTLHLSDVDIRDFLNLIHELSGRNIVVDSDVRGRVTAIMSDVTWEQALAAVLKANRLAGTLEGNIYRVSTEKTAPLEICAYQLSNANASDVARMIEPFLSPRGRVAADTRTNTLIVADVPSVLQTLGISPVPASKGKCGPPREQ